MKKAKSKPQFKKTTKNIYNVIIELLTIALILTKLIAQIISILKLA